MTAPLEAADAQSDPPTSLVQSRRLARVPWSGRHIVGLFAVPVLITAGVGQLAIPAVEDDLATRAGSVLRDHGLVGTTVAAHGRVLTLKVPTGEDPATAQTAVSAVPGVWRVVTEDVYASKKEERACTNIQAKLDKATKGQRIPFAGTSTSPTTAGKQMVSAVGALLRACRAAHVVVGGHADDAISNGSTISLKRAQTMVRQLRAAGVEAFRMTPRGYGDQFLIDNGDGAAARAKNHRGSILVEERP